MIEEEQELATIKKPNDPPEVVSNEEYERRIREIIKCKRDIVYFAEKYFRIVSIANGLMTIQLYEKQKEMLRHFVDNDRSIVCASRQIGKTTCYTIFCLWTCMFFPEKKIMICANKLQTSIEIMDRLRIAYEYLPYWLKCSVVVYNKGEMTFGNKSSIRAFATSSSASRGFSGNLVIIDEMGFVPKNIIDEFFASVMPVISSSKNSKAIIVSTPNGTGNLYYDIWKQANSENKEENAEGWKPFIVYWWEVPGRDEQWKEQQIKTIGKERFAQEFNNEFIAGSTFQKLIPDDVIEKFRIRLTNLKKSSRQFAEGKELQIFSENQGKVFPFRMWHEFDPNRTYAAAGDIAEGLGGSADSSVLYVFDITDLSHITMCAKFASNNVTPVEFAYVCNKILALYANPYFICERNGVGSSFLDVLKVTYEYPNIVKEGKNNEYGMRASGPSKMKALLWLKQMLTTVGYDWELYDEQLLQEMTMFIKDARSNNSSYKAAVGAHDDLVMTMCWLAWLINPEIVEKYFVVVETFKSDYDEILPKKISSQFDYSQNDIVNAIEDPLYRQYVSHKESMIAEYQKAMENEEHIEKDQMSMFNYGRKETVSRSRYEPKKMFVITGGAEYYTDDDFAGASW